MSLLEFCQWVQYSPLLTALRDSPWFFPVIASIHVMGLAVIGGAVLVGDLRLLGFGLSRQPVSLVVRDAERWLIAGLCVMIPTGILQFMCFATKYYFLRFFWVKIASLVLVLIFTFSIRRKIAAAADDAGATARNSRVAAVISSSLWMTIALGGRWIGFP